MEAWACRIPTGSMLTTTMKKRPKFKDQKENFRAVSFHAFHIYPEQSHVAVDGGEVTPCTYHRDWGEGVISASRKELYQLGGRNL